MPDVTQAVSRSQFIRNGAKGTLVLATAGGVLASAEGVAFAKGLTKSDIATLQVGYIAESLAVKVYEAILANFKHFHLSNRDYFVAALADEKAHRKAWGEALGTKHTPKGFKLSIPKKYTQSKKTVLATGVALETAFVETYLGAVKSFSSTDLKLAAAQVAANEASHFSFFDAAYGGHGVTKAFPGTLKATTAAKTLEADGFVKL